MLKKILQKKIKMLTIKYSIISLISYAFVFGGLLFMVEILKINKSISFVIVYAINYLFLYYFQSKYLFKSKHNLFKLLKFLIYLFSFYIIANLLFNLGLKLGIHYLVSTLLSILLLFPLRLITLKKIVYRD